MFFPDFFFSQSPPTQPQLTCHDIHFNNPHIINHNPGLDYGTRFPATVSRTVACAFARVPFPTKTIVFKPIHRSVNDICFNCIHQSAELPTLRIPSALFRSPLSLALSLCFFCFYLSFVFLLLRFAACRGLRLPAVVVVSFIERNELGLDLLKSNEATCKLNASNKKNRGGGRAE